MSMVRGNYSTLGCNIFIINIDNVEHRRCESAWNDPRQTREVYSQAIKGSTRGRSSEGSTTF